MKTLNNLKLRIMVRAFRIRIGNGETFEDIAADKPETRLDANYVFGTTTSTARDGAFCAAYIRKCAR